MLSAPPVMPNVNDKRCFTAQNSTHISRFLVKAMKHTSDPTINVPEHVPGSGSGPGPGSGSGPRPSVAAAARCAAAPSHGPGTDPDPGPGPDPGAFRND